MVIKSYNGVIFSNKNRKTYWINLKHTVPDEKSKGRKSMCYMILLT